MTSPNARRRLVDACYIKNKESSSSIRWRTAEPSDMLLSCEAEAWSLFAFSLSLRNANAGVDRVPSTSNAQVARPCRGRILRPSPEH